MVPGEKNNYVNSITRMVTRIITYWIQDVNYSNVICKLHTIERYIYSVASLVNSATYVGN